MQDLKVQTVLDRDLEVMFKTHTLLSDKDILNRSDLMMVFEKQFNSEKEH